MIFITDDINLIKYNPVLLNINAKDLFYNNKIINIEVNFLSRFEDLLADEFIRIIDNLSKSNINSFAINLGNIKENIYLIIDSISELLLKYSDLYNIIIYSNYMISIDNNLLNKFADYKAIELVNTGYVEDKFKRFNKDFKQDLEFRDYLNNIMLKRNLRPSDVYIPAQISCPLFSNIISYKYNPPYHPSKGTVAAIGIALRLDADEMQSLYNHAGYYLTTTEFQDIVIRFFINERIYDTFLINSLLLSHGQKCLIDKKSKSVTISGSREK